MLQAHAHTSPRVLQQVPQTPRSADGSKQQTLLAHAHAHEQQHKAYVQQPLPNEGTSHSVPQLDMHTPRESGTELEEDWQQQHRQLAPTFSQLSPRVTQEALQQSSESTSSPSDDSKGSKQEQALSYKTKVPDAGEYEITATICYADEVGSRVLSPRRRIVTPERKSMRETPRESSPASQHKSMRETPVPRLMTHLVSAEATAETSRGSSSPWRREHDEASSEREERQRRHIEKLQEALMAANQSLLETNQKLQVTLCHHEFSVPVFVYFPTFSFVW